MLLHETKGASSMQSHQQAQIDLSPEQSPMAIIGTILAQGAIRFLDRQKREQQATPEKSRKHVASTNLYSERKESAEKLSKRVNQKTI
jgi:hypothetical protein